MLCALAVTATAATAAEDEIFVDPGSPSGKEYALPIDSARQQAAAEARGGKTSGTKQTPLFGEGVDDRSASNSGSDAGGGSGDDGGASPAGAGAGKASQTSTTRSPGTAADGGTPITARAQAASPEGGLGTIAIIGAGAGVLLLGGAIGLLLRRRAARPT